MSKVEMKQLVGWSHDESRDDISFLDSLHSTVLSFRRTAVYLPAVDQLSEELDLQALILKEAIAARNDGAVELSLALLEQAIEHGYPSLWLAHHKALALRQMGDLAGAIGVWSELVEVEGMPGFTEKVVKQLEATEQQLADQKRAEEEALLNGLHAALADANRVAAHIPTVEAWSEELDLQALILKEAIAARNDGAVELSLALLEQAIEHGYPSLWLAHHKALGLRALGELDAAIGIWSSLTVHSIKGFSDQVHSCLEETKQQQIIDSAAVAAQNGNLEFAIEALAQALVQNPDHQKLNAALADYLRQRRSGDVEESDPYQAAQYFDQLDINHAFLMEIRNQLKDAGHSG